MYSLIDYEVILDRYASCEISKRQMLSYFNNDGAKLREYLTKIKKAAECRSLVLKNRNLEVVYLVGKSGSGKTTSAKYFAEQLHYDYFVSGSGEDILDGYDNEECIILDDFRGGTMKFSELLKFLDNNTGSSVKSRYFNKNINNCKIILITSVLYPEELYKSFQEMGSDEPIEQLMRRLKHHYFIVDKETDKILEYRTKEDTYYEFGKVSTVYKYFNINPDKVDDTSIMEKFRDSGYKKIEMHDTKEDTNTFIAKRI